MRVGNMEIRLPQHDHGGCIERRKNHRSPWQEFQEGR